MKEKTKLLKQINDYLQMRLEEEKMSLILNDDIPNVANIDFKDIIIKDIYYDVIEEARSYTNEYPCVVHVIQYKEKEYEFDVFIEDGPTTIVREKNTYSIYWDEYHGSDIHDNVYSRNRETGYNVTIMKLLNELGYGNFFAEEVEYFDFITEEENASLKSLYEEAKHHFPGLISIKPSFLNEVLMEFSTGAELVVNKHNIEMVIINQERRKKIAINS